MYNPYALTNMTTEWIPNAVVNIIRTVLYGIYQSVIVNPLSRLYLLGYWANSEQDKICYRITGVSEIDWSKHRTECEKVISNHFTSWIVIVETVFYFVILVKLLFWLKNVVIAAQTKKCIEKHTQTTTKSK